MMEEHEISVDAEDDLFESAQPWEPKKAADTLVIQCSSHDYRKYFVEIAEKFLKLPDYDLLSVPGGIQVFTLADYMPKFEALMRKWVKFLVKSHRLQRIVILGHEDCSWYRDFRFGPIHMDLKKRQIDDMRNVGEILRSTMGVRVEVYYAHRHGSAVTFTGIEQINP